MKHNEILKRLVADAQGDLNLLGFLVFGSVARGTHHDSSDIDVISILRANTPASGIDNTYMDDIKIGTVYFTRDVLEHGIETVPYLLHPLAEAKLLFDREGDLAPLFRHLRDFFSHHPEIVDEWALYYRQFENEKAQYGYEITTIVDVWNALEQRHSGGKIKRRFFLSMI